MENSKEQRLEKQKPQRWFKPDQTKDQRVRDSLRKEFEELLMTLPTTENAEANALRRLVDSPHLWMELVTRHPILRIYEPNDFYGSFCYTYCLGLVQLLDEVLSWFVDAYRQIHLEEPKLRGGWLTFRYDFNYAPGRDEYVGYSICRISSVEFLVIRRSDSRTRNEDGSRVRYP